MDNIANNCNKLYEIISSSNKLFEPRAKYPINCTAEIYIFDKNRRPKLNRNQYSFVTNSPSRYGFIKIIDQGNDNPIDYMIDPRKITNQTRRINSKAKTHNSRDCLNYPPLLEKLRCKLYQEKDLSLSLDAICMKNIKLIKDLKANEKKISASLKQCCSTKDRYIFLHTELNIQHKILQRRFFMLQQRENQYATNFCNSEISRQKLLHENNLLSFGRAKAQKEIVLLQQQIWDENFEQCMHCFTNFLTSHISPPANISKCRQGSDTAEETYSGINVLRRCLSGMFSNYRLTPFVRLLPRMIKRLVDPQAASTLSLTNMNL
jgi:hypothetical protein